MANFLENYETANATIKRFWNEFANGRINPIIDDKDLLKGYIFVKTEIYRDHNDSLPAVVDYAYGNVAFYPENMKKWFVEDTVTSSISRAIKLLSPSENRPSYEDMERVEKLAAVPYPKSLDEVHISSEVKNVGEALDDLSDQIVNGQTGDKECQHGLMIWKTGISPKTGKPYKGWTCPSKNRDFQCTAIWIN
tara:strand:- start:1221 stop:1799 length:579 start_codon:yes stop_codon:yes gene_type:complete